MTVKKTLCLVLALVLLCFAVPASAIAPLTLDTVDLEGNPVTNELLADATLVLVNFWEPWCGPCINEMPDLQKLYEAYGDRGLLVLGIFFTTEMKEDAKALAEEMGITYPILEGTADMAIYQSGYVPNTIFTDKNGNLVIDEPLIGARSYETWEAMVKVVFK